MCWKSALIAFITLCLFAGLGEALFEDSRCKCVCPNPAVVNGSESNRKMYIGTVPSEKCMCEVVVLPLSNFVDKDKAAKEFCPRCVCNYETRNTTTIRVVVIIIIWIISLLIIYMLFLMCLDPLMNKKTTSYQEHMDETTEVEAVPRYSGPPYGASTSSGNVLNRVGHQQFKWKRQVQEQRKNIYDRNVMLNWLEKLHQCCMVF